MELFSFQKNSFFLRKMWRYCEMNSDVIWYCDSQCERNSSHIVTHIARRLWENCEWRWIPLMSRTNLKEEAYWVGLISTMVNIKFCAMNSLESIAFVVYTYNICRHHHMWSSTLVVLTVYYHLQTKLFFSFPLSNWWMR